MEVTYSFPGIGNQLSFGSRNLMHNKIVMYGKPSYFARQTFAQDREPNKYTGAVPGLKLGKQFYLHTAMAQPLLPCPGLCPSNANRNGISQGYLLKTCPWVTVRISYCRTNMSFNFSSTLIFCIFNTKWLLKTEDKSIKTYWGETKHQTITWRKHKFLIPRRKTAWEHPMLIKTTTH